MSLCRHRVVIVEGAIQSPGRVAESVTIEGPKNFDQFRRSNILGSQSLSALLSHNFLLRLNLFE